MNKLSTIVDSLNLKYKYCDLNKTYLSKKQTVGYLIELTKGNIKSAKKDIDDNLGFEAFIKKYPEAVIEKNILIVRFDYTNYNDEEVMEFSEVDMTGGYGFRIQKQKNSNQNETIGANSWLYEYDEKDAYSDESLTAFYFPNSFTAKPLTEKYARMIGYADCLIDTTVTKVKNDAEEGYYNRLPTNWQKLSKKKKENLLTTMRSTKVVGSCSMDSSPRRHAINIAMLSAETINWEVFLRSHLDIMNDRFDRVSDGSYAQAERQTYIRELEELNINVPDLIFGVSMRIENASENHYYGSISRTGRALAESKNRDDIENAMLSMIKDSELDDYNRVLVYFLYLNYHHFLKDESLKTSALVKLKSAVTMLPEYLHTKITFKS
jgi:hypothetical protein